MDDGHDSEFKRDRLSAYPLPPQQQQHHLHHHQQQQQQQHHPSTSHAIAHMPSAETALHGYPPSQSATAGAGMPPPWNPTPSPYNENPDHRPPPPDLAHPPPPGYPPPPYPPASREAQGYFSEPAYSRHGSISGLSRSPAESHNHHYHPVNGQPPDAPYYPTHGHPDYRPRQAYGGPEGQPNGTHPPPIHVATGHEMIPGQAPGPPPPPPPPPGHYGHPPPSAGPPPTPGAYYFDAYGAAQRRKAVRATQACDSCRQRKAKCDEGRPECQHCKDNGLKCSYREVPPQKSEKQVIAITDKLESLGDNVSMLIEKSNAQDEKIDRLLEIQQSYLGQAHLPRSTVAGEPKGSYQPAKSRTAPPNSSGTYKREDSQPRNTYAPLERSFTSAGPEPEQTEENTLIDALPHKHTTAASNLLNWPSIRALVPKNMKASYVMDTESERGLLRLYGCGEGEDKGDGHEGAPSPAGSSSSEGRRLDEDRASSSPHGVWGSGQLNAPPTSNQSHSAREHAGGVSPHGGLMLDSEAVDRYFRSYMEKMHILHPFLEPKVLKGMVQTFKKKYSWDFRMQQPMATAGIGKRKRELTESPNSLDEFLPTTHAGRLQPRGLNPAMPPIEHSVANAIVLLVVALGKVCTYKDPLPGPAQTSAIRTSTPHTVYSDLPLPMSAPNSPFNAAANLSVNAAGTVLSPANPQGKNMDAIPGLAYFAKAADILGELPGGVDVSHIQAHLLAGLYMGQLARILPSHYYISNACKSCQILIESTPYTNGTMKPARRNLINFAFWSCLQLESDILAEVDLPPSGITRYEGQQHGQMPTGLTLDPIPESSNSEEILRYYSYQIQLRRTMNSVHSSLYRHQKKQQSKPSLTIIDILDKNLDAWRLMLNDWDWDDDDHMSENINIARMRGKYYGAKYIIHRPALHYALALGGPLTPNTKPSESPHGGGSNSEFPSPAVSYHYGSGYTNRRLSEMGPPTRGSDNIEKDILVAAKTCVNAAIRSTTAFDKVPRRLVITNIFGTAHAQFGNMLVLSATYTSPNPELSSLVEEATLRRLFDRTIQILHEHENISPVLGKDAKILQHVRANVFPGSYSHPGATSSFSSR